MLKIRTNISASDAQAILVRLVADGPEFTGTIGSDTFRLRTKPRLRRMPVTYFGRILSDGYTTQIRVWSIPALSSVIGFAIIFCAIKFSDAPPSYFAYLALAVFIISFIIESHRGYDLLRETFVASYEGS